jgi:hypothetical protein
MTQAAQRPRVGIALPDYIDVARRGIDSCPALTFRATS